MSLLHDCALVSGVEQGILFRGAMVRALLREREPKTQTRRVVNPQPTQMLGELHPRMRGRLAEFMDGTEYDERCGKTIHLIDSAVAKYGKPGSRLFVKETFARVPMTAFDCIAFQATAGSVLRDAVTKWTPSIFMPRKVSRVSLEVTKVRVERVSAISAADALAEGLSVVSKDEGRTWKFGIPDRDGQPGTDDDGWAWREWSSDPVEAYRRLWNSINLAPAPVYGRDEATGKKGIVSYECFPWSLEDFLLAYPKLSGPSVWRGKPLRVMANPWVWVYEFKRVPKAGGVL